MLRMGGQERKYTEDINENTENFLELFMIVNVDLLIVTNINTATKKPHVISSECWKLIINICY